MAFTRRKFAAFTLAFSAGLEYRLTAQSATLVRYLPFEDVRPALAAFSGESYSTELPPELKSRTATQADWAARLASRWRLSGRIHTCRRNGRAVHGPVRKKLPLPVPFRIHPLEPDGIQPPRRGI